MGLLVPASRQNGADDDHGDSREVCRLEYGVPLDQRTQECPNHCTYYDETPKKGGLTVVVLLKVRPLRVPGIKEVCDKEKEYRRGEENQDPEKADLAHEVEVPAFPPLLEEGKKDPDLKKDVDPMELNRIPRPKKVGRAGEDLGQSKTNDHRNEDHQELE